MVKQINLECSECFLMNVTFENIHVRIFLLWAMCKLMSFQMREKAEIYNIISYAEV